MIRAALALEGRRAGDLTVVLADDAELRRLNRAWRGLDRATDVLSFSYDEPAGPRRGRPQRRAGDGAVNGDLVISLDRVGEQARRFRVTRGRELARLAIHGTLHLAGHDHRHAAERRAMRAREEAALAAARDAIRALDAAYGRTRAPRPAGSAAR